MSIHLRPSGDKWPHAVLLPLVPPKSRSERKHRGSSEDTPEPTPSATSCLTAVSGDVCYGHMDFARQNSNLGLNPGSSDFDAQTAVRNNQLQYEPDAVTCQEPCPPSPTACFTAVSGDVCYGHMNYARQNSNLGLNPGSSDFDAQTAVRNNQLQYEPDAVTCQEPCPPSPTACFTARRGAHRRSSVLD